MSTNGGIPLFIHSNVRGVIYMVYSLPLVPTDQLQVALDLIYAEFRDLAVGVQDKLNWLSPFMDYVMNTWVRRYPLSEWNHYSSLDMENLTNNGVIFLFTIIHTYSTSQ